jgi:hypothetical protein
MQLAFELSPFLAGLFLGFVDRKQFSALFLSRPNFVIGSIAVGCTCSFLAAELFHGLGSALVAIGLDSGATAFGYAMAGTLAVFFRRSRTFFLRD